MPSVRMIKLTEAREITPYKWGHPDEERWISRRRPLFPCSIQQQKPGSIASRTRYGLKRSGVGGRPPAGI